MKLGDLLSGDTAPQVKAVNVLGDDELDLSGYLVILTHPVVTHLSDLHQLGKSHVSLGRFGLVPTDIHVGLLTFLLQSPDSFGTSKVRDPRRRRYSGSRVDHDMPGRADPLRESVDLV